MQIAVVHDYFTQLGGAEKVAEHIGDMFPDAPLFSTVAYPDKTPTRLQGRSMTTTWMQHLPMMRKAYRAYFMLYPMAVRSLDLSAFDLIVSSSSGYIKGVHIRPGATHVCYCHTPMRWAWYFDEYSAREKMGLVKRIVLPPLIHQLRKIDLEAARQPTHYVANSSVVAERIQRIYGRPARVIYPPIDLNRFQPSSQQGDYYLILARLVSYKRIDLAIEACSRLNRKLVVIGSGPDLQRLKSLAGPTVQFTGRLSDAEVERYASQCRALLFPGEEDFGMAPLEIAAAGKPTVAYRAGGAKETIVENQTGVFFDEQTTPSLMDAIERFEKQSWDAASIRAHAQKFSVDVFEESFFRYLAELGFSFPQHRVEQVS